MASKLVQRASAVDGQKLTVVEMVAAHIATDLTFATVEIPKPTRQEEDA